jgi:hypothetical protein
MKRWIAVLVVVMAIAPCGARADVASKQAKVRQLFVTMRMDHMLDQMMSAIEKQVQAVAQTTPGAQNMTPEQKKLTQNFMDNAMKAVRESVGWNALEPDYVKLYADTYTEEEIDGILAFYKSPVGQKMLEMTPQLTEGGMKIVRSRMGDFQPKIQALQEEYMKQLAATMPATSAGKPEIH